MRGTRLWRSAVAAGAVGLVAALAVAGCGTSGSSSRTGDRQVAPGQDGAKADGAPAGQGEPAPGGDQPAQLPTKIVQSDRSIVYTGSITVRVSNVDQAATAAGALATGAGGFVAGDNRTNSDRRSQAQLVLRVPSGRFAAVVDGLGKLGEERSRALSTKDVTDQVVDLESRVATAQASVDRVRALLARAQNIGEIVSLETELSRRESDLESLKARQRKLADLTELSTITAVLLGPDATAGAERQTGFVAGLHAGWRAFVASLEVMLTVLGAMVPWLVALAVPLLAIWLVLRRYRRRQSPPVTPAPATVPANVEPPTE